MSEVTQEDKRCADLMYLAVNDMKRRREIAARHRIASTTALQAELAEARAEVERLRGFLTEVTDAIEDGSLGQSICCSGHECGCYGADKGSFLVWNIRQALAGKETP
jgi:alkylation response protein AidB-like acyl-CoA dehydrogenase